MKQLLSLFIIYLFLASSSSFAASDNGHPLADIKLDRSQAALQRGANAVINSCMLCHQLKYIKYRNLLDIGFDQATVDAMRKDNPMSSLLPTGLDKKLVEDMFGIVPPDLALMAKARKGGPAYIYTLLTSYHEQADGRIENLLFPGIAMPDPTAHSVTEDAAAKKEIEAKILDIASFLEWTADPHAQERKTMGIYVIIYLVILTIMLYIVKKRVWARLD
ncbi:MAG: cytochrome c1 [Gammaproteobacteria bacterium]|nr:cytochrome c1 [Gammaproteobacteria bacterium]